MGPIQFIDALCQLDILFIVFAIFNGIQIAFDYYMVVSCWRIFGKVYLYEFDCRIRYLIDLFVI